MKTNYLKSIAVLLTALAINASAAVRYVNLNNATPVSPYTNWATAATAIQDAVDVATNGDLVLVTNGVYETGGRVVSALTNRVVVTKPLRVQSVNGPYVTVIKGYQLPGTINGDGAIRCVYLTNGAFLSGFTITNGATGTDTSHLSGSYGGGVYCSSRNAIVTDCIITGNCAYDSGGGVKSCTLSNCVLTGNSAKYDGGATDSTLNNCVLMGNSADWNGGGAGGSTLYNCTLTGNSANYGAGASFCTLNNCTLTGNSAGIYGGGTDGCTLNNCTLTGNSAPTAGGARYGTLNNCIVYFNTAQDGANYYSGTLNYCCTTPSPGGTGNLILDPQLASASHLSASSPCRGAGSAAYASGTDIDGETWASPPSIGCDEYHAGAVTGALNVSVRASYTNVFVGFPVILTAGIEGRTSLSVWDFGDGTVVSNRPNISHAWTSPGDYMVVLTGYNESQPYGVSVTLTVQVVTEAVHYVAVDSELPLAPYTNWATAARTIQEAVDAAIVPGALILVSNGVYAAGGRAVTDLMTNRVAVTKPLKVQSVNGSAVTVIKGYQLPGTTNGDGAIRCVYLAKGAFLSGFTLTNGATRSTGANESAGGGVWCESTNALVTGCIFAGNSASGYGGGAFSGTLSNCTLTDNSAYYGGGAFSNRLSNCTLTGNSATFGGGADRGTLNNCTLTGNAASYGGGASWSSLNNCIVYFNSARRDGTNYYSGTLNYCCATPIANGTGNLTLDPQLASASYLSAGSPCRGAGSAAYASGTDIDGEAWASPPSIGCDEYHAGAVTGPLTVSARVSSSSVMACNPLSFTATIEGRTSLSVWDVGDGTVISNQPYATHAWASSGEYVVVLTAFNESRPGGVSVTLNIHVFPQPVHYVAVESEAPLAPYTNWATAARTIQEAVDAATMPGALVLVSNGVYAAGGRVVYGTMTNRVVVNKPLQLRSVNGPQYTVIQGYQVPGITNGDGAIRCVYLTNGASLSGFTLSHGATRNAGDSRERNGGGVWCVSASALITNCTLTGNAASSAGGGAYSGTLNNCMLTSNSTTNFGGGVNSSTLNDCVLAGNSATYGGGSYDSTLNNCTLTGNSATYGGGSYSGALKNCIVYFNTAPIGTNYSTGTLNFCCTTPMPTNGAGNLTLDPQLASASHLSAGSPCRGAGSAAYASGTDIDGEAWASLPSIGCDEYRSGAVTGPLTLSARVSSTSVMAWYPLTFTAEIEGRTSLSFWNFGDGTVVSNQPYATHVWTNSGDYLVVLTAYNESQPGGVTTALTIHVSPFPSVHYVSAESGAPAAPYADWATAARTIQDAVDMAKLPGALVLVSNGVYAAGGRAVYGTMTNRVVVNKPLELRSVNGPQFTVIQGYQVPGATNGNGAIRCVYLTNGASLSGFTLSNGATRSSGDYYRERSGGGVWCASADAVITDCTFTGNAAYFGGGVYLGTLDRCTLAGNTAYEGGATYSNLLSRCVLMGNLASYGGGGARYGALSNCTLLGNSAMYGGGAHSSTLNNCTLTGNSAHNGGGAAAGTLINCTLVGNTATNSGGGTHSSAINNCIVYFNSAPNGSNYDSGGLDYCCTTPMPDIGVGNITNLPLFVDQAGGNLRLQSNSPCINAGNNAYPTFTSDLDGNPRIRGGTVDIGAYEFQTPLSLLSYAWAQQYGLPTDGSADFVDTDGDRLNNWQEWRAGTVPTSAASVLKLLPPAPGAGGTVVSWQSVSNRTYFLERSTELAAQPAFTTVQSNLAGVSGITSCLDTNAVGDGPFFYRIGLQQ